MEGDQPHQKNCQPSSEKYTVKWEINRNECSDNNSTMYNSNDKNKMLWYCKMTLSYYPGTSVSAWAVTVRVYSCVKKLRASVELTATPFVSHETHKGETEGFTVAGQDIGSTMYVPERVLGKRFTLSFVLTVTEESILEDQSQLTSNLSALLLSGKHSDFIIVVEDEEFAVHKAILAARSPIFAAMFEHEMEESTQNRLVIQDIGPNVLKGLLEYVYTDGVADLDPIAQDLLAVADKYALQKLKTMCEISLLANLTVETATKTVVAADLYRADQLKQHALSFISRNPDVTQTEDWKSLMLARPELLNEVFCEVMKTI